MEGLRKDKKSSVMIVGIADELQNWHFKNTSIQ